MESDLMNILVIGINYSPERTSVGPFTTGLCEHLAARGHHVTVITSFPYYPEWRTWDEYRGSLHRREIINNVNVHRVIHYVPTKPSRFLQRMAYDLSFTFTAFVAALFTGKCDLIYCSCPPPTVAHAAWALGKLKGAPYVIKLTDLASEAALATGILHDGIALRIARGMEAFAYRRARAVVCLCQGFVDSLVKMGIEPGKLHVISDWADTERIRPIARDMSFLEDHEIPPDKFIVLHTGNMGKKQCLINVIQAAELSREMSQLIWLLVGQGEDRAALEREIAIRGLDNIRVLPLQPAAALPQVYASAGALLLNQIAAMEDAVIPSKLLTYMAAGRPVVAAVSERSEAARHIEHARCGVVIPAENPQALVDAVVQLHGDSNLCQQLGENGRKYAETHFTKSFVLGEYDRFVERIV
jgi:colanic acid biosynthesis glycosyl transferase WcaI